MAQRNRWHPVMLPADYLRKLKRGLSAAETCREPALDDPPRSDDASMPAHVPPESGPC